uniref:Uncharacterized protein n=1 Tax=Rhizochromulina marina TaxID=1034831 RepID=A0A7S2SKI7_9STRA|mmetsp:Transcript_31235/g.90807  ORF Transcript_31235/g.90807 Transcript_31235/m.90807 type:complete len:353 (+) Transcript_31235:3-1061(+)
MTSCGEREYLLLLQVATQHGAADRASAILHGLSEDVLLPTRESWKVLGDWFTSPYAAAEWVISPDAPVDPVTGYSELSHLTLRSIDLGGEERQRMLEQVSELALTGKDGAAKWAGFTGWLERKGRTAFDVLVDGANVGYFKQNYPGAPKHVNYEQIDCVVRHFQAQGKRVLLFLHQRHLFPQNLPASCVDLTKRWKSEKTLFTTPVGSNDDWFWLYAAVWLENVQVVTNDEMRDHHFRMLSHRSFQRWKERHQIHYEFGGFDSSLRGRRVITHVPPTYSIRMQASTDPTSGEVTAWHVPSLLDESQRAEDFVGESRPVDAHRVKWLCIHRRQPPEPEDGGQVKPPPAPGTGV